MRRLRRLLPPLAAALAAAAALVPAARPQQPVPATLSQRYLLAFGACDPARGSCDTPAGFTETLAQSNDGVRWSPVPGFTGQPGARPDPVRRGSELYVYDAQEDAGGTIGGTLRRFALARGALTELPPARDALELTDPAQARKAQEASPGSFAASAGVDDSGRIVVLYALQLDAQAGACPVPGTACVKLRTATEVAGSDGAELAGDPGDRAVITLAPGDSAGDPVLFRDRTGWLAALSGPGGCLQLLTATDVRGAFRDVRGLPGGCLTTGPSAPRTASGYWDAALGEYWLYGQAQDAASGIASVRRATAAKLTGPLPTARFRTLAPGRAFPWLAPGTVVSSPRFAPNGS